MCNCPKELQPVSQLVAATLSLNDGAILKNVVPISPLDTETQVQIE